MSNMSYCRFENTVKDMRDCYGAMAESGFDISEMIVNASSEYEARAMIRFVELIRDIANDIEDIEI